MTILEDCREASEVTIKYQLWTKEGILIKFPTDGREDEKGVSIGDTSRLIPGFVSYRTELDLSIIGYVVWGSCVSQSNLSDNEGGIEREFCGNTIYWTAKLQSGKNKEGVTIENKSGYYSIVYEDGSYSRPRWIEISQSTFNSKDYKKVEEDKQSGKTFFWVNIWNYSTRYSRLPVNSDCNIIFRKTPNLKIVRNSIVLDEITTVDEYYKTIAIREDGSETEVTTRSTVPISGEYVPEGLAPEQEVVFQKKPDVEDIEVVATTGYIAFYRINIANGTKTYLNGFFQSSRQGLPVWSHSCSTNECPENTCKVDCGNHYCCYGSDGISVFAYEK